VWNAVRHDEAGQPIPRPSDFNGGLVDNLELKSRVTLSRAFAERRRSAGRNNRRRVMGE
jgi:hypothetical protein